MATTEAGPKVFDPEEMMTPDQRKERFENYCRAVITLAKDDTKKPAEKGALLADAFSALTQDRKTREIEITRAKMVLEQVTGNTPETKALWAGLLAELASADLLTSLEGITEVDYPTLEEDLYHSTDWKAKTENGEVLSIQTKTISLEKSREEMKDKSLPVLSSVKSVGELRQFLRAIEKISLDMIIYHKNRSISISQLGGEPIDIKSISFAIVPDEEYIRVPKDQDQNHNNRLEELCFQAARMHCLFRDSDERPVVCLVGSPDAMGSDVNTKLGTVSTEAQIRAAGDLDRIISIDK